MATPVYTSDGNVANAALFNRAVISDGLKIQVKIWHARLTWSGAIAEINVSNDVAGFDSTIVFNAGTTAFDVALTGFTNAPVVQVSRSLATVSEPRVESTSASTVSVGFYDNAGVKDVSGVGSTNHDFFITVIGF